MFRRNGTRSIVFNGMIVAFLVGLLLFLAGVRADNESNSTEELFAGFGLQLSFAEWCSTSFCNLRLFTLVGGELLMVDSGSSSLAFCEPPNTEFVTDQKRVFVYDENEDRHNISQCTKYGSGGHGWFGATFTGTIESAGLKTNGQVYTVMNTTVGLDGNQCGKIFPGSIGLEENTTVRGILGTGGNDQYTYSEYINASTWTELAIKSGQCLWDECKCPPPVAWSIPSTFQATLSTYEVYQFAITWDGTLGKNTGMMLWNEDADANIPENYPKVPIEIDPSKSYQLWSTNVTGMAIDGVLTNQTRRLYFFDTGAGFISLPEEIFDSVSDGSVVTFYFPTIDDSEPGNTVPLNMTITQELIDARVFRRASADSFHLMGLNIFRYLDNLLINFNATQPYYQSLRREPHIVELPKSLPVGELATSKSENVQELNVTNSTTGDINQDSTNVISTTIMNNTGVTPPSVATTIGKAEMGVTRFVALVVATLVLI